MRSLHSPSEGGSSKLHFGPEGHPASGRESTRQWRKRNRGARGRQLLSATRHRWRRYLLRDRAVDCDPSRGHHRRAMTQRKGETTKRQVDRNYRHQVAIRIPLGGLGASLTAMHAFTDALTPDYKTRPDRRDVGDFTRFCFVTR